MINIRQKRYQVALWETEDRTGSAAALHMEFDTLEEAQAAFAAQRQLGRYRSGILMEWHKISGVWNMIDTYRQ